MLPTALPRTVRGSSAAGAKQCKPAERKADRARRRAKGSAARARAVAPRSGGHHAGSPAGADFLDDTPLGRVRHAMSRHQVDAILVLDRADGAPLRWVTRDGLVRAAEPKPALAGARQALGEVVSQLSDLTSLAQLRELGVSAAAGLPTPTWHSYWAKAPDGLSKNSASDRYWPYAFLPVHALFEPLYRRLKWLRV